MEKNHPMKSMFHKRLRDDLITLDCADETSKAAIGRVVEAYAIWRNQAVGYQKGFCELV